jgi:hypothetical protein
MVFLLSIDSYELLRCSGRRRVRHSHVRGQVLEVTPTDLASPELDVARLTQLGEDFLDAVG